MPAVASVPASEVPSAALPLRPPETTDRVLETVSSAACPATSGHRNTMVTSTITRRAQPMALAEEASAACRDRQMMNTPSAASTTNAQRSKTVRCRVSTTLVISGSNTPRKSGEKAASSTAPVAATIVVGISRIQLPIAVPIEASGFRTMSEPQPRSYVFQRTPA